MILTLYYSKYDADNAFVGRVAPQLYFVDIEKQRLEESLMLGADWFLNNQEESGLLRYEYDPIKDEYTNGSSIIRQMAGCWVFSEIYGYTKNESHRIGAKKCLDYSLKNLYREDQWIGIAYVEDAGKIHPSTAGFLILTMLNLDPASYATETKMLANFILYMQNNDGSFNTSYSPMEKVRSQEDYYPGEAMLALMELYNHSGDAAYLAAVERAFPYYRDYFSTNRNSAFVPWQTMTYTLVYLETRKNDYADFIFEMNDWLVTQQNDLNTYRKDYVGGYFKDSRVTGTGVYNEGMNDAFLVARDVGDGIRTEKYRKSVLLATGFMLRQQLNHENSGYVKNETRGIGGFRTSPKDSNIRIDGMQHCLHSIMKTLSYFEKEDYYFNF